MKPNYEVELSKLIDMYDKAEWVNEHGERFVIHSNGTGVFLSGDEVNAMVDPKYLWGSKYLPLFSDHFSVWNVNELFDLGLALNDLAHRIKLKGGKA